MPDRYIDPSSGSTIRRLTTNKGNGYVLTIKGNAGQTVLVIRDDGAMIDTSGDPIIRSDVTIAQLFLPRVNAPSLRLQQGDHGAKFFQAALRQLSGR